VCVCVCVCVCVGAPGCTVDSTAQPGAPIVVKPSTTSKKRVWLLSHSNVQSGRVVFRSATLEPGHVTDVNRYASRELGFMPTSALTVDTICRSTA